MMGSERGKGGRRRRKGGELLPGIPVSVFAISFPGRGQSTLLAATFPF